MSLPSKEYWEKRAESTLIANEKRVLDYEKELKSAYKVTEARIKTEVEAFYQRYSKETGLDLATTRQRLNPRQVKDFKQRQELYLKEVNTYGADPEYKTYLKRLSARAYITKMDEILANIRGEIETLNSRVNKDLTGVLSDSYEDSFYRTMFDIHKNAGYGVSFTALGKKQLERAIKTPWLGENYSDRIWRNKNALLQQLTQLVPQELVRGRGPVQMAKDISDRLGVSESNALRLVRTELNHISADASLSAYKESGVVEEYQFSSTLDTRTSTICRDLDGRVFKLSEAQTGVNLPPMHPNCRSTTIPYFPDDEISDYIQDRVARNEDGKTYRVGKNVTYREWASKYASKEYAERVKKNPKVYAVVDAPVTVLSTPETLKQYEEHARAWEQEDVLSRISEEDVTLIEEKLKEVIDNGEFCMRIPGPVLDIILRDGRFKNQMETNASRGAFNPEMRKRASNHLFGTDTTKAKPEDYEKYGYLGLKDAKQEYNAGYGVNQYGDIRFTFKKSNLMNRTTFTTTDSLGPSAPTFGDYAIIGGRVTEPRANGIEKYKLKQFAKILKESEVDTDNPFTFIKPIRGRYFELQYHGKLSLEDVEAITMRDARFKQLPETTKKLLEESGIPLKIVE